MSGQLQSKYMNTEQKQLRMVIQRCLTRRKYYEDQYRKYDMLQDFYKSELYTKHGIIYGRTKPKSHFRYRRKKKQ